METKGNTIKYTVPLNAVDLSLLPISNIAPKQSTSFLPLWSKQNLNQRDEDLYYEFEVKDVSDSDTYNTSSVISSNAELDTEMITNICYICNLEVPQQYMINHTNSLKHKINLKIADVAMERVKKYMNQNHVVESPNPVMYFCQTCVSVVHTKDKILHLNSMTHKNAAKLDYLLQNLFKLYVDENEIEIDDVGELNLVEIPKCYNIDKIFKNTVDGTIKNDNNSIKLKKVEDNFTDSLEKKEEYEKILDKEVDITADNVTVAKEENHGELKNIHINTKFTCKYKELDNNYIQISTEDGCEVKVTFNNFHSFLKIGKLHIQCKLCTEIFKDQNDHLNSEKHMQKIALPIKDRHCIRELTESKSYCILCNDLIESKDIHVECSVEHNLQLQLAMLLDEKIKEKGDEMFEGNKKIYPEDDQEINTENKSNNLNEDTNFQHNYSDVELQEEVFCYICKIHIHRNNLTSHMNGRKHKINTKQSSHYLMKKSPNPDSLICRICNTTISMEDTETHLLNLDHIKGYKDILNTNNIIMKKKDKFYCKLCEVILVKGCEIYHINGKRHKTLFDASETKNTKALEIENKKPNTDENLLYQMSQLMVIKKYQNTKVYFCEVCQVTVPNNQFNITMHNSGVPHQKKLSKSSLPENNEKELTKIGKSSSKQIDTENNEKNEFLKSISVNTKSKVKNDFLAHTCMQVSESDGKDKVNPKSDTFYKLEIPNDESVPVETMLSINKKKLEENQTNINVTYKTKEQSPLNQVLVHEQIHLYITQVMTDPKVVKCKICNVNIQNHTFNIKEHIIGYNHTNLIKILEDNKLRIMGNMFFCDLCYEFIGMGYHNSHINGKKHKEGNEMKHEREAKFSGTNNTIKATSEISMMKENSLNIDFQKPSTSKDAINDTKVVNEVTTESNCFEIKYLDNANEVVCQVCKVNIPKKSSNIDEHVKGLRHTTKLEKMLRDNEIGHNENKFVCLLCAVGFPKEALFDHISDELHVTNSAVAFKIDNGEYCVVCNTTIPKTCFREQHILTPEHINQVKLLMQLNNYLCEICDVFLTNNDANISEHNNGAQHKNKVKIMEKNTILFKDKKYYCQLCDESFSYKNIFRHIQSSNHLILRGDDGY